MKSLFASKKFALYGALGVVALSAVAAGVWFMMPGSGQQVALPPIKEVSVPAGFVGKQAFGMWTLACENPKADAAGAKHVCRTNARVVVKKPKAGGLALAAGLNVVMADNQKSAGLLFRLPRAAGAANSVKFFVDKGVAFQAPLRCTQTECLAHGVLPAEAVEQMRNGRTISVVYTIKNREQKDVKVRVDHLLHGFRQAYDGMRTAMVHS